MAKNGRPEPQAAHVCSPPRVEVRRRRGALGRGVFAAAAFAPGDLVERAPLLVVERGGRLRPPRVPPALDEFYFCWPGGYAIALGYLSLYNHSYRPNAEVTMLHKEHVAEVRAVTRVRPGDELRINYGGEGGEEKMWFRVV